MNRSPRTRSRASITTRVLTTGLVFVVSAGMLGIFSIRAARDTARRADEVVAEVSSATRLLTLRMALFDERINVTLHHLPARALTAPLVSEDDVTRSRVATDEAIVAIAASGENVPISTNSLAYTRQLVRATDPSESLGGLATIQGELDEALTDRLATAARNRLDNDAVDRIGTIVDTGVAAADLVIHLAEYVVVQPLDESTAGANLAGAAAIFDTFCATLAVAAGDPASAPTDQIAGRQAELIKAMGTEFDLVVDRALQGRARADLTDADLAAILRSGLTRSDAINQMAIDSLDRVAADVGAVRDAAARDARQTTVLVALAMVVLTIGAFWFARSITQPLGQLRANARRLQAGEVTIDPLPLDTPVEVADAAAAINETAASLRRLESKARALAAADLDALALHQPSPGGIGEAIDASVRVLAESMASERALLDQITRDATHDGLTGRRNRMGFLDVLTPLLDGADPAATTVVAIALDEFRSVNDAYGYPSGDEVLRTTAARLARFGGPDSPVARLGGDEFVVCVPTTDASRLCRALATAIAVPIGVDGIVVSACITTTAVRADDTPETLLRRGDLAMLWAKRKGRGSLIDFDRDVESDWLQRRDIEGALELALGVDDQLHLYLQGVVDAHTHHPLGAEALLRWQRPGVGSVSPAVFVPVAERSPLIERVDRWVFGHAFALGRAWDDHPELEHLRISVNVSGRHLDSPRLVADVADALETAGCRAERLTLEITETAFMTDLDQSSRRMHHLRDLGVRIAMDDFGTGYTGFTHLRRLPLDVLKLDRSLTVGLADAGEARSSIELLCAHAHDLGARVVAEGIEDEEQATILTEAGCDALQGFHFHRPSPPDEALAWLRTATEASRPADSVG